MCKIWNEKMDAFTLFNKPLFRAERDLPNSVNLRLNPGQILPFGIAPVQMPSTPMDFDKEVQQTQAIAEQRVTVPDYGIMADRDRRTATEIESVNAQAQQNMDLRLHLFRQALGDLFRMSWSVLLQFDKSCYINSGGLASLIDIASEGRKKNQKIHAYGLSEHFQKIFHMVGLTRCIPIFSSEKSALENF